MQSQTRWRRNVLLGLRGYFLATALLGLIGSASSSAVITISECNVSLEGIPFANVVGSLVIASLLSLVDSISPKPTPDTSIDSIAAWSGVAIGVVAGFVLLIIPYVVKSNCVILFITGTLVICLGAIATAILVSPKEP